ncbi:endopeptidase La [Polyangium aurulentum]|uniref:endopeptidase La n=1 Tax=Polyangium aurulentum TaxID=2567896 RepID=UPI0010AEAF8B|nr:endopeptidase La [Polyangium aurulentum]UQA55694.1 endopeptidase La [Polyangium aurulentum]
MFFKNDSDRAKAAPERGVAPLLPLRDIIVFPYMVSQLFVGRERSIAALDEAMNRGKEIFLAAQRNAKTNDPTPEDIFAVGSVGVIMQLLRLPDGTVKVLIEGKRRAKIRRYVQTDAFFLVEYEEIPEKTAMNVEVEALMRSVQSTFEVYVKLNKKIQPEILMSVQAIDDASRLADAIVANLPTIKLADRQALLETDDAKQRLERLIELMQAEIEILQVEKKIRSRVKKQMEKTQKEYYLNEQMQAIQKELGGGERDEFKNEIQEIEEALKTKRMSKEATAKVKKELKKLKMMHPTSAEATVVRNYIDWILDLPWYEKTEERYDLGEAEKILEEDHYGLKKIKERILEYLAVQALTKKLKGPVLCFVGPPGVGKTSLAKSIARATGRRFVRLSLGGVRDEAEIRGHRRTYIGALPGKLIQSLKKAGSNNPVFLLDEVDKMSTDFRGDPAAALLEVLDPEQNHAFNDHYLDLDYDLSDVMFITTANTLSGIPVPLQDRMEIIQLSGYTEFEKLNIALKYLVPRQRKECGLEDVKLDFTEGAVRTIIHHYTKESGVRSLEREVASVCRKVARKVVSDGKDKPIEVTAKSIPKYLGVPKYRLGKRSDHDEVGLVNGLAVTSVGGDLLPAEAVVLPGKGKLVVTGLLEKGMEESAQAAMSYVRSHLERLGLANDAYQKVDVHVHFPDFVRKDGPSAGVTMVTAVVSALIKMPVRQDLAMTGEVTLRGRVLPIGGLKEKLLAAHRSGISTVIMPKENRKDLRDVPRRVLRSLRLVLVEHVDDVLREALILPDPQKVFGPPKSVLEYRDGELVTPNGQPAPGLPALPSDSPAEQPGA